eukprot:c15089_g1_i1.p1 GENE.c15089_g1_i1~~c15089_g1_i1.p1  ORF type:complete len:119 (-),score=13.60 c15089_g1_i1:41-397(-)
MSAGAERVSEHIQSRPKAKRITSFKFSHRTASESASKASTATAITPLVDVSQDLDGVVKRRQNNPKLRKNTSITGGDYAAQDWSVRGPDPKPRLTIEEQPVQSNKHRSPRMFCCCGQQ